MRDLLNPLLLYRRTRTAGDAKKSISFLSRCTKAGFCSVNVGFFPTDSLRASHAVFANLGCRRGFLLQFLSKLTFLSNQPWGRSVAINKEAKSNRLGNVESGRWKGSTMEKVSKLRSILLRLSSYVGEGDNSLSQRDLEALTQAGCRDLALAQQSVLDAGVDAMALWRVWVRNRDMLPDQVAKLRVQLPDNHILQRVLAEHEMTLCFIADLDDVNTEIQQIEYASSSNQQIRRLAHIAGHLISAEQHCEREEDVIFPELRRRGYRGLLKVLDQEHLEIGTCQDKLNTLVWQIDSIYFPQFKEKLSKLVGFLVPSVRMHIFVEGNILFPLALEVIDDSQVWARMKDICDQIGYCGYHV